MTRLLDRLFAWLLTAVMSFFLMACPTQPTPAPVVPPPVPGSLATVASIAAFYACPYFTTVGDATSLQILKDLDTAFSINPVTALTQLENLGALLTPNGAVAGVWSAVNTVLGTLGTAAAWEAAYAPIAKAAVEGCMQSLTPQTT